MSTDIHDLYDTEVVSDCCSAKVYSELGICADCKEHCDSIKLEDSEV